MPGIQTYTYKIHPYHTDGSGNLFIHQLLNFLQDAANSHADASGFGQQQLVERNLLWVLSRLTIEVSSLPKHGQEIVLSTWVKSIRGAISEREFSISVDNKTIVTASSLWFCLSGESHKPAKLPQEFSDSMKIKDSYATTFGTEKVGELPPQGDKSIGKVVIAGYSDIDMADHVNNATYARWFMDEVPVEYLQKNTLEKITINYLGECFLGEEVKVSHRHDTEYRLFHEVSSSSTKQVICRAQTQWLK